MRSRPAHSCLLTTLLLGCVAPVCLSHAQAPAQGQPLPRTAAPESTPPPPGQADSPRSREQVFFKSGGRMQGQLLQSDGVRMQFRHNASPSPLALKVQGIEFVLFDVPSTDPDYTDRVRFKNGDLLPCRLEKMDKNTFTVRALQDKSFTIPGDQIARFYFSAGNPLPLIHSPQSFALRETPKRPETPGFLSTLNKKQQKADRTETDDPVSVDEWRGRSLNRWKWLGTAEDHSLEIPAGRGMVSKAIGMTDRFTLSGSYYGPSDVGRKNRVNNNAFSFGMNIIIGGTYEEVNGYLDGNNYGDFYVLELYPAQVNLYRYAKSENKKTLLISRKMPIDLKKRGSSYSFQLKGIDNEIQLTIDKEPPVSAIDRSQDRVRSGQFTLMNTEYIPIILKNITLTTTPRIIDFPSEKETGQKDGVKVLLTTDGDELPGEIALFEPQKSRLNWAVSGENSVPRAIDLEFISSITVGAPQPKKKGVLLELATSGTLRGTLLSLDEASVKLKHAALGELTLPRTRIRKMEFLDPLPKQQEKEVKP